MSEANHAKKRFRHPDRVILSAEAIEVLKKHNFQIHDEFQGTVRLTYAQLVNFLILHRCDGLSIDEFTRLRETYFDEIKVLQWAVSKLKTARANGESFSATEILKMLRTEDAKKAKVPRAPKKKRKKVEGDTPSPNEVQNQTDS